MLSDSTATALAWVQPRHRLAPSTQRRHRALRKWAQGSRTGRERLQTPQGQKKKLTCISTSEASTGKHGMITGGCMGSLLSFRYRNSAAPSSSSVCRATCHRMPTLMHCVFMYVIVQGAKVSLIVCSAPEGFPDLLQSTSAGPDAVEHCHTSISSCKLRSQQQIKLSNPGLLPGSRGRSSCQPA